jgi:hypothetical protein
MPPSVTLGCVGGRGRGWAEVGGGLSAAAVRVGRGRKRARAGASVRVRAPRPGRPAGGRGGTSRARARARGAHLERGRKEKSDALCGRGGGRGTEGERAGAQRRGGASGRSLVCCLHPRGCACWVAGSRLKQAAPAPGPPVTGVISSLRRTDSFPADGQRGAACARERRRCTAAPASAPAGRPARVRAPQTTPTHSACNRCLGQRLSRSAGRVRSPLPPQIRAWRWGTWRRPPQVGAGLGDGGGRSGGGPACTPPAPSQRCL